MIDWAYVARNALWVLGLSVALAASGYTSWWASVRQVPVRAAVERRAFRLAFSLGMLLFTAGLARGATRPWERVLWSVLALTFAWLAATSLSRPSATRMGTKDGTAQDEQHEQDGQDGQDG
jgi:hypothetical protein